MPVRYETDGPIAVVTIDRPEVANAVDAETAERLVEAFEKFDADAELSVAILTGAGGEVLGRRRPEGNDGGPRHHRPPGRAGAARSDAHDALEAGDRRCRRPCRRGRLGTRTLV